jgi:mannitol 2-dehydrogenase
MSDFFWFSDEQWARIKPFLPSNKRGARRVDDRRVISGIVHSLKSGGRWVDCPEIYGPKKTLYNRFVRWSERGIWQGIFSGLTAQAGLPETLMIDSTCIKVHRTAGGAKGGPLPMILVGPKAASIPKSMP